MPTQLYSEESKMEKGLRYGVIALFIAFVIWLPFGIQNKQKRLEQQWQDQGCQMYDMKLSQDVPAKCKNDFTDHYKPQQPRLQPPEEK